MLESRKDRKPLDVNNVIYWFKNARAAQKRNEMRYNGLSPHHSFSSHHHHQTSSLHRHHDPLNAFPSHLHPDHLRSQQQLLLRAEGMDEDELDSSKLRHSHNSETEDQEFMGSENSVSSCREDSNQEGLDLMKESKQKLENSSDKETSKSDEGEEEINSGNRIENESFIKVDIEDGPASFPEDENENNENDSHTMKDSSVRRNNNEQPKDLRSNSGSGAETIIIKKEECPDNSEDRGMMVESSSVAKNHHLDEEDKNCLQKDESRITPDTGKGGSGSNHSCCASLSPRSSPGMSPSNPYDFGAPPPSMVGRFHPLFDHPSLMAYHRNFMPFGNFGQNFTSPPGPASDGAYESAMSAAGRKMLPLG